MLLIVSFLCVFPFLSIGVVLLILLSCWFLHMLTNRVVPAAIRVIWIDEVTPHLSDQLSNGMTVEAVPSVGRKCQLKYLKIR